jgi:hypothetical protein
LKSWIKTELSRRIWTTENLSSKGTPCIYIFIAVFKLLEGWAWRESCNCPLLFTNRCGPLLADILERLKRMLRIFADTLGHEYQHLLRGTSTRREAAFIEAATAQIANRDSSDSDEESEELEE